MSPRRVFPSRQLGVVIVGITTAAVVGLLAGCDGKSESTSSGYSTTSYGNSSADSAGSSAGEADSSYSDAYYDQLRDQVYDDVQDDYFDNCRWSQGCGGDMNAWNGSDSNSVTGDDDLDPLGNG